MRVKPGHALLKGFVTLFVALPMLYSCFDDSELWEKIESIEARLDSLESSLNGQIKAFSDFLAGGDITISSCVQNDNGSYSLTLSNGTKFTMLPDSTDVSALVSYVEIDGVKYWAAPDAEGKLTPLLGAAGKKLPVISAVPVVEERDGVYYLIFDGKEYITGYNTEDFVSIFTSYTLNRDEAGQLYSATFTFGEDMSFTVSLDGYSGFSFLDSSAEKTTEYYVAYGETVDILVEAPGVVDFVMQVPEGWKAKERVEEFDGSRYVTVTAPDKDPETSFNEGNLKVVAVLEGGKAVAATLKLTTNPFKVFAAAPSKAVITNYVGVDKFIYGLSSAADFNASNMHADAAALLGGTPKTGVALAEDAVSVDYSDILGQDLTLGEKYVLWAVPVLCTYVGETAEVLADEENMVTTEFTHLSVELSDPVPSFDDANITVAMEEVTSYYAGTSFASETLQDDVLKKINSGSIKPVTEPFEYEGSAFTFPSPLANAGILLNPGSEYCTWIVPVRDGRSVYVPEDMIYKDFTLKLIEKGGVATVADDGSEVDCVSIKVNLKHEKAKQIYYAFMTERTASRYPDNDLKADYVLKNGTMISVADGTPVALIENLKPQTRMTLLAVAVDADGKYGTVMSETYQTKPIEYNAIKLTLTAETIKDKMATIKIGYTGGLPTDYVYWVASENNKDWIATFDRSESAVAEYLCLCKDPEQDPLLYDSRNQVTIENGMISVRDLYGDTQYRLVVVAKDADGKPSKYRSLIFKTMSVDLGEIVKSDQQIWKDAKNQIKIDWKEDKFHEGEESAIYAFDITVPSTHTAYIWCITESYFKENTSTQTIEQQIVDIEKYCSRKYDAGRTIYEEVAPGKFEHKIEPLWYDDNGKDHTGHLMNVYDYYVHGFPTNGFVTYFAQSHGEGNCTSWENGQCYNYNYAVAGITKHQTLEYYIEYVKSNRGSYCTQENTILKAAQDLLNAYLPYYEDSQPKLYINNGEALYMEQHYGAGPDDSGNVVDDVYVVLKDASGNYYEPMKFDVPNYFK